MGLRVEVWTVRSRGGQGRGGLGYAHQPIHRLQYSKINLTIVQEPKSSQCYEQQRHAYIWLQQFFMARLWCISSNAQAPCVIIVTYRSFGVNDALLKELSVIGSFSPAWCDWSQLYCTRLNLCFKGEKYVISTLILLPCKPWSSNILQVITQ